MYWVIAEYDLVPGINYEVMDYRTTVKERPVVILFLGVLCLVLDHVDIFVSWFWNRRYIEVADVGLGGESS